MSQRDRLGGKLAALAVLPPTPGPGDAVGPRDDPPTGARIQGRRLAMTLGCREGGMPTWSDAARLL
jgi:hypothetical protein